MSNGIPDSWAMAPLSELLISLESGSRPRGGVRGITHGIPSVGGEHLKYDGTFDFSSVKFVPRKFADKMTKGYIKTGDILVVKDGATTGKTSFVDSSFPFKNAFVNEHVFICRSSNRVDPRYLFYFLFSKEGQNRILENFKGSAQGGINQSFALNTQIPVAPISEQHRIVEKLQKLLSKMDNSQSCLIKIPIILKRFRQSVLAAACSGRLTADWRSNDLLSNGFPETWKIQNLSDLCVLITKGASPKWQGVSYATAGILFVTSENVGLGKLLLDTKKYVEAKINEIQPRSVLRKGDLLTNIVGASIGRSAIYDLTEPANINQAVSLIRLKEGVDRKYILHVLNSPIMVDYMNSKKVDVARANLSLKDVSSFPIPVPPPAEQQEIVHRVKELFGLADKIETRYNKAHSYIDKLEQSILAKAFRGELVKQER